MAAGIGINLAPGSVTDLSGKSLRNPFATGVTQGRQVVTGRIVDGGTVSTAAPNLPGVTSFLFSTSPYDNNVVYETSGFPLINPSPADPGKSLVANPGSTLLLSGASDTYDQLTATGAYVQSPQWSSGGDLTIGAGATLSGASIQAAGRRGGGGWAGC